MAHHRPHRHDHRMDPTNETALCFGHLRGEREVQKSGAIVTESVFNLPGVGAYVVKSVFEYDFYAILDVTVVAALAITLMNLLVDVVYAYLDPRVRYT